MRLEELVSTPVADIARREAVRVPLQARVQEAVERMCEARRGSVLVEDARRLSGIFTERDLMMRVDVGASGWTDIAVKDVMTAAPVTVRESSTLAAALRRMISGNFRHLPVVDREDKALGILSIRDILRHLAEAFPQEFINLPPDPEREAHERWGG